MSKNPFQQDSLSLGHLLDSLIEKTKPFHRKNDHFTAVVVPPSQPQSEPFRDECMIDDSISNINRVTDRFDHHNKEDHYLHSSLSSFPSHSRDDADDLSESQSSSLYDEKSNIRMQQCDYPHVSSIDKNKTLDGPAVSSSSNLMREESCRENREKRRQKLAQTRLQNRNNSSGGSSGNILSRRRSAGNGNLSLEGVSNRPIERQSSRSASAEMVKLEKQRKKEERLLKNREISYRWRQRNRENTLSLREQNEELQRHVDQLKSQVSLLSQQIEHYKQSGAHREQHQQQYPHPHQHKHPKSPASVPTSSGAYTDYTGGNDKPHNFFPYEDGEQDVSIGTELKKFLPKVGSPKYGNPSSSKSRPMSPKERLASPRYQVGIRPFSPRT